MSQRLRTTFLTLVAFLALSAVAVPPASAGVVDDASEALSSFAKAAGAKKPKSDALKSLRKATAHVHVAQRLDADGKSGQAKLHAAAALIELATHAEAVGANIEAVDEELSKKVAAKKAQLDKDIKETLDQLPDGAKIIDAMASMGYEPHGHGSCVLPGQVVCGGVCCESWERCGDHKCRPRDEKITDPTGAGEVATPGGN